MHVDSGESVGHIKWMRCFWCVALVLSACGGGGNSATPPTDPPVSTSNAAPTQPKLVEVSSQAVGQVVVSWLPATDDKTPAQSIRYQVHAATDAAFTPSAASLKFEASGVATANIASGWIPGGRYAVRVLAIDEQGATSNSEVLTVAVSDTAATAVATARVTQLQAAQVTSVDADAVVLSANVSSVRVGEYLASAEGTGFLRAVQSISGTTVQTRKAALNEVLSDVRLGSAISLSALPSAQPLQTGNAPATLVVNQGGGRTELVWPTSGLRLSANAPAAAPITRRILSTGSGPARPLAITASGSNVDVSTLLAAGGIGQFATLAAPDTVGIISGTVGSFTVDTAINRDDSTRFRNQRIPLAICEIRAEDNPLPGAISVANAAATETQTEDISTSAGTYTALRKGTFRINLNMATVTARPEPYKFRLRLFLDEAERQCAGSLFGWAETVVVDIKVVVVSTPNFPRGESKQLSFDAPSVRATNDISFAFDPTLEFEFLMSSGGLQRARIEAKGRAELRQVLTVAADAAGSLDVTKNLIDERKFIKVFMAGSVPVVVTGAFSVDMRVEGNVTGSLTVTETLSYSLEDIVYGAMYENGQWTTSGKVRPVHTLSVVGDALAEANLTVSLIPKLTLSVYESATGRLALVPYLLAEAGLRGKVVAQTVNGNLTLDRDAWIEKARLSAGVDAYVMADLSVLDRAVLTWPSGAVPTDYKSFRAIPDIVPRTPILGIPSLAAVLDLNSKHPTDSRAILVKGLATNVSNPFPWGPPAFITFEQWSKPLVVAQNNAGYVVLDSLPGASPGDFWIRFTAPGAYTVRVGGHSTMGGWARQIAEVAIVLTDANANGIVDQWETKYGLVGSGSGIANADPDGDGLTNLQEYLAGSDPLRRSGPIPSIEVAIDDFGPELGAIGRGGLTDDQLPVLNGTLDFPLTAGQTIKVYDGTQLLASIAASPSERTFSYAVPSPLSEGRHTFQAVVMASDGSELTRSATWDLTVYTSTVAKFGLGYLHGCALLNSGGIKCWGQSYHSHLGNGAHLVYSSAAVATDVIGMSVGVKNAWFGEIESCGLLDSGEIKCWGMGVTTSKSANPAIATAIPAAIGKPTSSYALNCFVDSLNALRCYGDNTTGQWGIGIYNPVCAGCSGGFADLDLALSQPTVLGLDRDIIGAVSGKYHSCALTVFGAVHCWGSNFVGQLGIGTYAVPNTNSNVSSVPLPVVGLDSGVSLIASGTYAICVLASGSVKCWGGIPGLPGDAEFQPWGAGTPGPVAISGLAKDVREVAISTAAICGLTQAGGVKCIGRKGYLGNGTNDSSAVAVDVPGLTEGVLKIAGGGSQVCALTVAQAVMCWGYIWDPAIRDVAYALSPRVVQQF